MQRSLSEEKDTEQRFHSLESNLITVKDELTIKRGDIAKITATKNDIARKTDLLQDEIERYKKAIQSMDTRLKVRSTIRIRSYVFTDHDRGIQCTVPRYTDEKN